MIIEEMKIAKFRNIIDMTFKFGSKVTFIAGSNGTSKTSLLGLIGQPFTFTEQENNNTIKYRTIVGKAFQTKFGDIHNFTQYDNIQDIEYTLTLTKAFNKDLVVRGEKRPVTDKTKYRFVVNPRKRIRGEGNFKIPVLYFGLKRLHPLGEHLEKDVKIKNDIIITSEEQDLFNFYHRELFIDTSVNFSVENVQTPTKKMLGGKNEHYDSHGFSSGQDNISQLITAIISFKRLKDELNYNYKGGILLIDEIEATLHPITQEKLIINLYKIAKDLKLQIIVTTHSLEIIRLGMQPKYKRDTEIIYLSKTRGTLKYIPTKSYDEIKEDMTAKILKKRKPTKIQVFCEDDEAALFLNVLLTKELKNKIKIISAKLGHGTLTSVAKSPISKANNFIFILDGDQNNINQNNVLILPGNASPEELIYDFLDSLDVSDKFFKEPSPAKQVYFREYTTKPSDRNQFKDFFKSLNNNIHKTTCRKLFKLWKEKNNTDVERFINEFNIALTKLEYI